MIDINNKNILNTLHDSTSRVELWRQVLDMLQTRTMLEVGVWKGDFAEQILRTCKSVDRYYMIDPWANLPDWNKPFNVASEMFEEIYREAMHKTEFASDKRLVLKGRTQEVIDAIPDNSLDFAYIDGDHTLRGITIDLIKILPKIKEGGIIGGDDFINTPWQHNILYEPTLVCPFSIYFAEAHDLPIAALPHNQFLMQKESAAKFSFTDTTGNYQDISLNKLSAAADDARPSNPTSSWLAKLINRDT